MLGHEFALNDVKLGGLLELRFHDDLLCLTELVTTALVGEVDCKSARRFARKASQFEFCLPYE